MAKKPTSSPKKTPVKKPTTPKTKAAATKTPSKTKKPVAKPVAKKPLVPKSHDHADAKALEEKVRQHTARHEKLKRRLLIAVTIVFVILVLLVIGLIQQSRQSSEATKRLSDLLPLANDGTGNAKVEDRDKGVGFRYDQDTMNVETYDTTDTTQQAKPGTEGPIYKVSPKEKSPSKIESELYVVSPQAGVPIDELKQQYGNLEPIELAIRHFSPKSSRTKTINQVTRSDSKPQDKLVTKIIYKETDSQYVKTDSLHEYIFVVADNRAYAVWLTNIDSADQDQLNSLRGVMSTLEFSAPNNSKREQSSKRATFKLASAEVDIKGDANVPTQLEGETLLKVAARNHPGVVRIATIHCANITLLVGGKNHSTYADACTGGIGSGSIVSSDGYVATNGHVTRIPISDAIMSRIFADLEANNTNSASDYIDFLLASGLMSRSDILAMLKGLESGDTVAQDKLVKSASLIPDANLKTDNEKYEYSIQLANKPMRLEMSGAQWSVAKDSTIVAATYVDSDYEDTPPDVILKGGSTSSDVSILKIDGKDMPVISLGSTAAVKAQSLITAMGYPAFVDNGLQTKQATTTPSVTQGKIIDIQADSAENIRQLYLSSTPIAAGNSGGPAFDTDGKQIGLNTYGILGACPDDNCFSQQSIFRGVEDYKKLLEKNSVTLNTDSIYQKSWSSGIDNFAAGKYREATKDFEKAAEIYKNNTLSQRFIDASKQGALTQPNSNNPVEVIGSKTGLIILGTLLLISVVGAVAIIIVIKNHKHKSPVYGYPVGQAGYPYPQQVGYQQYPQQQYAAPQPQVQPQQPIYQQAPVQYAQPQQPVQQVAQPSIVTPQPQPVAERTDYPQIHSSQHRASTPGINVAPQQAPVAPQPVQQTQPQPTPVQQPASKPSDDSNEVEVSIKH